MKSSISLSPLRYTLVILGIVFCWLLAACRQKPNSSPTASVISPSWTAALSATPSPFFTPTETPPQIPSLGLTPEPIISPAIQPSYTPTVKIISVTPSRLSNTVTETRTQTPIIPPEVVNDKCLKVAGSPMPDAYAGGVVVLTNPRYQDASLMNIQKGTKISLPAQNNQEFGGFFVSPNRKWLAGVLTTDEQPPSRSLVLFTANGIQSQVVSVAGGFSVDGWLNDENVVLIPSKWDGQIPQPLTLINPFTGKVLEIPPDYPDIDNFSHLMWGFYSGPTRTVYDPTLRRVLYPRFGTGVVLWDVSAQKEIAVFPTKDIYGKNPKWSPDGKSLAIVTDVGESRETIYYKDEFFIISKEGEIKQLTHMAEYYYSVAIVEEYAWSPDGHSIAFAMSFESYPFTGQQLAVMDTQTGRVTNYCDLGNFTRFTTPVWSPDGTQFLAAEIEPTDTGIGSLILIDIIHNKAVKLGENLIPEGWMVSP